MADNNIKTICVRLNLGKPLHHKAYDFLQVQSEHKSTNQAIIAAVVDYAESQSRDDKLVAKIITALAGVAPPAITRTPETAQSKCAEAADSDIDFDFLGG